MQWELLLPGRGISLGIEYFKGNPTCRPAELEVDGWSPAHRSSVPKELKLVLAGSGQVLAHIVEGPEVLFFQAQLDLGNPMIPLVRGSALLQKDTPKNDISFEG